MPSNRITDKTKTSTNGAAHGAAHNGVAQESKGLDVLISQADDLKRSLRDATQKTTELIAALKRERKQNRAIRSTLASLRQLQNVEL